MELDYYIGGFLIRPEPWEVRRLAQSISRQYPVQLFWQPAVGLLLADAGPDVLAIDYSGNPVKRLPVIGVGGWTILPDGKRAVTVNEKNRIVFEDISRREEDRH